MDRSSAKLLGELEEIRSIGNVWFNFKVPTVCFSWYLLIELLLVHFSLSLHRTNSDSLVRPLAPLTEYDPRVLSHLLRIRSERGEKDVHIRN
jgi:hypothetical protein